MLAIDVAIDGQFFIGLAALLGSIMAAYLSLRKDILAVKKEVTTMNAQSLAQYGDARETVRINAKAASGEELTKDEQDHLDMLDETGRLKRP